jgi:hypothetical protein
MQTLFSRHQHRLMTLTQQLDTRLVLREKLLPCLSSAAQHALLDASIEGNTLKLLTTNATWASRLRLSSRQLLQACADNQVNQLSVHIAQSVSETQLHSLPTPRQKPNPETLIQLEAWHDQLDPRDPLTQSLRRLLTSVSH